MTDAQLVCMSVDWGGWKEAKSCGRSVDQSVSLWAHELSRFVSAYSSSLLVLSPVNRHKQRRGPASMFA